MRRHLFFVIVFRACSCNSILMASFSPSKVLLGNVDSPGHCACDVTKKEAQPAVQPSSCKSIGHEQQVVDDEEEDEERRQHFNNVFLSLAIIYSSPSCPFQKSSQVSLPSSNAAMLALTARLIDFSR